MEIVDDEPLARVGLLDPRGQPVLSRRLPGTAHTAQLELPRGEYGRYTVQVRTAAGVDHEEALDFAPPPFPLVVSVAAPAGQALVPVSAGARLEVPVLAGDEVDLAVRLEALEDVSLTADLGGQGGRDLELRADERWFEVLPLDGPRSLRLQTDSATWEAEVVPVPADAEALRAALELEEVVFPATPAGTPDLGRPRGRVSLAAGWWRGLLQALGLGVRARDPHSPWSHQGLTLHNHGEADLNVVVEAVVLDGAGELAEPFRARVRAGQDQSGRVRVLLRVPAGRSARTSLPLHVHEALLDEVDVAEEAWTRRITVAALGSRQPLHVVEEPLYVSRGSTVASLGLVGSVLAAVLGAGLLALRGRRWLEERATSELMTISLFGALTFLVGALGRLLTMGFAAVLGPFATLLTNLVDDAFRYTLLATLVTLLPRPGTGALAVLTGWLLSGIALGSFSATDVLFVGSRVLFLEGALYVFGLTRDPGWREQAAVLRWLRLSAAFGIASVLTSATGLVLHVTLYRLFLADWYVAMVLVGPGFLYVVAACALAVPFSESLRRIQR